MNRLLCCAAVISGLSGAGGRLNAQPAPGTSTVYAVDEYNNNLVVWTVATGTGASIGPLVVDTGIFNLYPIPAPTALVGGPCKVAVTPNGTQAIVSSYKGSPDAPALAGGGSTFTLDAVQDITTEGAVAIAVPFPAIPVNATGGTGCNWPAVSPDSTMVYVPVEKGGGAPANLVVEVAAAAPGVAPNAGGVITIGGIPGHIAVSPDDATLWVPYGTQVDVVAVADGAVTMTYQFSQFGKQNTVDAVAFSPTGMVYITSGVGTNLFALDPATGTITPIPLNHGGGTRADIAGISPDGTLLYINWGDLSIEVVDTVTGATSFPYSVMQAPGPATLDPTGTVLYTGTPTGLGAWSTAPPYALLGGVAYNPANYPSSALALSNYHSAALPASTSVVASPLFHGFTGISTTPVPPPQVIEIPAVSAFNNEVAEIKATVYNPATLGASFTGPLAGNSVYWQLVPFANGVCADPASAALTTSNGTITNANFPAAEPYFSAGFTSPWFPQDSGNIPNSGIGAVQTVPIYACRPNIPPAPPSFASSTITLFGALSLSAATSSGTITNANANFSGATTLWAGQSVTFTADYPTATFSLTSLTGSSAVGSLNITGANTAVYTAPASIGSPVTMQVTAKTTYMGATDNYNAIITLLPSSTVAISPNAVTLPPGAQQYFGATVRNSSYYGQQLTATFSLSGPGTLNPTTGQYVAPATISTATTATITATLVAPDGTKTSTATITLTPGSTHPAFFTGEVPLGGGVYYLQFPDGTPFGYYNFPSSSVLYHYDMGFEAFIDGGNGAAYMYDFSSGHWWYTSSSLFPYLYDFTLNNWLYYFPATNNPGHYTANPRSFSDLSTGKIIKM